jgi:hypothetical protein
MNQKITTIFLNIIISISTLLIGLGLIDSTKWLFASRATPYYDMTYFSLVLPLELLSVLSVLTVFIKELNFSQEFSKSAVSLLLFNLYSFFVISNYYPLLAIDGYEYSEFYCLAYQTFLSLSNYITFIYGVDFIIRRIIGWPR